MKSILIIMVLALSACCADPIIVKPPEPVIVIKKIPVACLDSIKDAPTLPVIPPTGIVPQTIIRIEREELLKADAAALRAQIAPCLKL